MHPLFPVRSLTDRFDNSLCFYGERVEPPSPQRDLQLATFEEVCAIVWGVWKLHGNYIYRTPKPV